MVKMMFIFTYVFLSGAVRGVFCDSGVLMRDFG